MAGAAFAREYRALHADANVNYQLHRFLGTEPVEELRALAARIRDDADWKRVMLEAAAAHDAASRRARAAWYFRAAEYGNLELALGVIRDWAAERTRHAK